MRNRFTKVLVLTLSLLAITCFSLACASAHTHSYGEKYFYNETSHWFECECGEEKGEELHEFIDGVCKCGYEEESGEHLHSYPEKYSFDKEYHWLECECGQSKDKEIHSFTNGVCKCGYEEESGGHEHIYSETYSFNENFHWLECECGEKKATTQHAFIDGKCVCGYEDSEISDHTHIYIKQKYNALSHWYECVCGARYGEVAHSGGSATCSKKAVCAECEQEYGELKEHQYTLRFDYDYHWEECEYGEIINKEAHYGGIATFTEKAICEKCEQPYGNYKEAKTVNLMPSFGGYGTAWIQEIIEKFEALYADEGYKINLLPSDGLGSSLALAEMRLGAKGSGYDLVFPGSVFAYDALDPNYGSCVECLDDVYASKPISFDGTTEARSLNTKLTVDDSMAWMIEDIYNVQYGEKYGFFNNQNVRGLVCNTDVLKAYAGITNFDEKYPRTSEELFALYDVIMENEDAKNSGVRPVIYGGGNAATYSVAPTWTSVAQILGKDEYNKQWSMEEFYAQNGNRYYADDWKYYAENEAIMPTLEYIMQSWDDLYAVQGADAITHNVAHGQLMIDLAAFMYDGNYFYEEVRYGFPDALDKIRMIPMPVVSYVGIKQELCGENHNVGYGNNNGVKCSECDEILSAIIKGIDDGMSLSTVKAQVQSALGVSITDAQVSAIYEARTCGYGGTSPAYILKDSEVKDVAKLFLRMLASEDSARIMEKYGMISCYSKPQSNYKTPKFIEDCFEIKNNQTWEVVVQNKPDNKRVISWIPTFSATIGVQLHAYMYGDNTYKDRDYAKMAREIFNGRIYSSTEIHFANDVRNLGLNYSSSNNPNANYHN
ncbi:MAG: hypothetical protein IJC72_04130 [Clostridia bacterium]|nr:hypothetical protein [Clostridia bacterium]